MPLRCLNSKVVLLRSLWKDDSSDVYFWLSSFCGSPAMKSGILRCCDNLNLTSPPPNEGTIWPLQYLEEYFLQITVFLAIISRKYPHSPCGWKWKSVGNTLRTLLELHGFFHDFVNFGWNSRKPLKHLQKSEIPHDFERPRSEILNFVSRPFLFFATNCSIDSIRHSENKNVI